MAAITGKILTEINLVGQNGFNVTNTWSIISQPAGSIANLTPSLSPNDITFKSDLIGDYIVRDSWIDIDEFGDETTGTISYEITLSVASIITQTHAIELLGTSDCSKFAFKVTANVLFNVINGQSITSTLEYILLKSRSTDGVLAVEIEATDTGNGTSILSNNWNIPFMNEPTAEVVYLDVMMSQPIGLPTQSIQYDFGGGSGYEDYTEFHYTTPGVKTINCRDNYGCVKTIQVTAVALPVVDMHDYLSIFYVSKANPIRFVLRESIGLCGNYINDENSFGCEVPFVGENYEDVQRIRRCWDVKNQFKSGFDTHQAFLYNSDTDEVVGSALPITEIVKNIGYEDIREYLYKEDTNYSYLYFDEFNMIPSFYEIGGIVTIGTESNTILNILYLEEYDIWAIKTLKFTYNSSDLKYTYNREDYNIYEFLLPSTTLGSLKYYIEITSERTTATEAAENKIETHRSNIFDIQYEFERVVDIIYWNNTNNDIYWAEGFKGVLTVGIDYRKSLNEHETEVIRTDGSTYLKKSFGVEKFEFLFEPMTQEISVKLKYALSQYNVAINGVMYSFDEINMDSIDSDTNDYIIKAIGIKSNKNINFISNLKRFDWSSGTVTFDSSITFDNTVTTI